MGIQEVALVAGGEALVLQRVYQAAGEGVIHQDKLLFVRQVRSWVAARLPREPDR